MTDDLGYIPTTPSPPPRPSAGRAGPLVTVIVRTDRGGELLTQTLRSVLCQTHRNLQTILTGTGHADVPEAIDSLDAPRLGHQIVHVRAEADAPPARATNAALARAQGKYVAYADAGDLFYPRHVEHLVAALEGSGECGVAYADHYRTYRRGSPQCPGPVLSKVLSENLRYDPLWLCRRDYIPPVCLVHRRDLLDRTGPCNEDLSLLADWDLVRRLAFHSGLAYLPTLSAERCAWVQDDGRICDATRRQANLRLREQLLVRTHRPPKPWPCMPDLSIVLAPQVADERTMQVLRAMWRWTFAPYEVLLALPAYELAAARTEMPNLVRVPVSASESHAERVDRALAACQGEYVAVVPPELPIGDAWVEPALHVLIHRTARGEGVFLDRAPEGCWAAVVRKADLLRARRACPNLSVPAGLAEVGVRVRKPRLAELPFQYEPLIAQADGLERIGDGLHAARLLEKLRREHPDDLSLRLRAAQALYLTRRHDEQALALCREVNRHQPTAESLMLEAKIHRRADRLRDAVDLLEQSRRILNWKG